jgi:transposase InsO family protein
MDGVGPLQRCLPLYGDRELLIGTVLTDNGKKFCGTDTHPYEVLLSLAAIEHRWTKVNHPHTNGFVERVHWTVLDGIFRVKLRATRYESLDALQTDLDGWLPYYNQERPHLDYRNLGRRLVDMVNEYLATRSTSELSTSLVRQEAHC